MESVLAGIVIVPGVVALLLFLVFTYLYQQSREAYFRAWQIGWGAYCLHYLLVALNFFSPPSAVLYLASNLLLVIMSMCIFLSTRLMREEFRVRWYDVALAGGLTAIAIWNVWAHFVHDTFRLDLDLHWHLRLELAVGAVLLFCAFRFFRQARVVTADHGAGNPIRQAPSASSSPDVDQNRSKTR